MPYFTTAEARAFAPELADPGKYLDQAITNTRLLVEEAIEDAARVAFEPRTQTETVHGDGSHWLRLSKRKVREITSIAEDGVASSLTGFQVVGSRTLYAPNQWTPGIANLVVTYTHGFAAPPLRLKRAALILTKNWLAKGPIDDRATQIPTGDGGSINLLTPGVQGAVFGIPEPDAAIIQYGYQDAEL